MRRERASQSRWQACARAVRRRRRRRRSVVVVVASRLDIFGGELDVSRHLSKFTSRWGPRNSDMEDMHVFIFCCVLRPHDVMNLNTGFGRNMPDYPECVASSSMLMV